MKICVGLKHAIPGLLPLYFYRYATEALMSGIL